MDSTFWLVFVPVVVLLLGVWYGVDQGVQALICRWRGHEDVRRIEGRTLRLECLRCRRTTPGVTLPGSVTTFAAQFRAYGQTRARRC